MSHGFFRTVVPGALAPLWPRAEEIALPHGGAITLRLPGRGRGRRKLQVLIPLAIPLRAPRRSLTRGN
jgi:hypothetical protein